MNPKDTTSYRFRDDGSIPNNPELPLVLYRQVVGEEERKPSAVKQLLKRNGWTGAWVNGVYSYHHYHSTAHEVLVVTSGYAEVQFGGKRGDAVKVKAGDGVVIPAGVGHCLLNGSDDFQVVGAYPEGQTWDMCTGKPEERPRVVDNIGKVPLPEKDPFTGTRKPLLDNWEQTAK